MQAGAPQTPSRSWLIAAGATVVAGAIGFVWNRYPVIVARTGLYAVATTRSGWRVYTMVPNLAIFARSDRKSTRLNSSH